MGGGSWAAGLGFLRFVVADGERGGGASSHLVRVMSLETV